MLLSRSVAFRLFIPTLLILTVPLLVTRFTLIAVSLCMFPLRSKPEAEATPPKVVNAVSKQIINNIETAFFIAYTPYVLGRNAPDAVYLSGVRIGYPTPGAGGSLFQIFAYGAGYIVLAHLPYILVNGFGRMS
jgi:hypothetical protein